MTELKNTQARLSKNKDCIIDSNGQSVEYSDPRIVHVYLPDASSYAKRLQIKIYEKHERKIRLSQDTDKEILHLSRRLCSGRECVPMVANAGSAIKDILKYREEDEITLYLTLDDPGSCQHAAWPIAWETFAKRLDLRDAIYGIWPIPSNQNLGMGPGFPLELVSSFILGDLFDEAETALKCLAKDKTGAVELFNAAFERFSLSFKKDTTATKPALECWTQEVSSIPLKASLETTPKVLIFGGLNVQFVHYPVTDYFICEGVIPKINNISEGLLWLMSQRVMRYGLSKGFISPLEQFSIPRLEKLSSETGDKMAALAKMSRLMMSAIEENIEEYRKIMEKSGLLYDTHVPFVEMIEKGHNHATYNGFTETPITTGRYLCAVEDDIFDGLINLGSFNCPPAMNSQATIRPIANKNDMPYAAIDCEGPWLSSNQKRLLETIATQAKRRRLKKNAHSGR